MQKKAQFDDRIRNLIALAKDGTPHSRTLLFSHISDLFLQKRPMASPKQVRMLTEILKELLNQVDMSKRQEVANALCALNEPPEALVNLMSEDIVEVSGPLLEKAILPDERLIHIIRYGSDAHRIHISRRFGLSPLVRQELERAQQAAAGTKLKFSLNDLEKRADTNAPDLDEETTVNILELLRAQDIHNASSISSSSEASIKENAPPPSDEHQHSADPANFMPESGIVPEKVHVKFDHLNTLPTAEKRTAEDAEEMETTSGNPHVVEAEAMASRKPEPVAPVDIAFKDSSRVFSNAVAANDATMPDSTINLGDIAPDLLQDIWYKAQEAKKETNKAREFVRTVADWFWEVDRIGAISFLSEEAFTVFGRPAQTLIGEDFISLCTPVDAKDSTDQSAESFASLFEHRSSFRNIPFYISSQKGDKSLWYISAIAIFDIHTGRFTGFRGSARSEIGEDKMDTHLVPPAPKATLKMPTEAHGDEIEPQQTSIPRYAQANGHGIAIDSGNGPDDEVAAELLHNLSHEFRTPLNAIIGFSEMIDMETWGPVNPQYHQHTKNILAAAGQLKEAVNDVLDSAKLEAGLIQIDPESFSLQSLIKDCLSNVAPMAEKNKVHLSDNGNNIDVILYNDKQSVELCLTKMLASVIKRATGGEAISLSVLINSNAQVRIEMPILGPEINEQDKDKLFQKLKTEPDEQKKSPKYDNGYEPKISSNYGLSIAKDLAIMIGGDISCHSSQGKVTHLVLTLSNHELSS